LKTNYPLGGITNINKVYDTSISHKGLVDKEKGGLYKFKK